MAGTSPVPTCYIHQSDTLREDIGIHYQEYVDGSERRVCSGIREMLREIPLLTGKLFAIDDWLYEAISDLVARIEEVF